MCQSWKTSQACPSSTQLVHCRSLLVWISCALQVPSSLCMKVTMHAHDNDLVVPWLSSLYPLLSSSLFWWSRSVRRNNFMEDFDSVILLCTYGSTSQAWGVAATLGFCYCHASFDVCSHVISFDWKARNISPRVIIRPGIPSDTTYSAADVFKPVHQHSLAHCLKSIRGCICTCILVCCCP